MRIDGNNAIGNLANASTIMVTGDNAKVDDTEILNNVQAPHDYTAAAVYFICGSCTGNVISNSVIHNHYYGVIFQAALTSASVNQVVDSEILKQAAAGRNEDRDHRADQGRQQWK